MHSIKPSSTLVGSTLHMHLQAEVKMCSSD